MTLVYYRGPCTVFRPQPHQTITGEHYIERVGLDAKHITITSASGRSFGNLFQCWQEHGSTTRGSRRNTIWRFQGRPSHVVHCGAIREGLRRFLKLRDEKRRPGDGDPGKSAGFKSLSDKPTMHPGEVIYNYRPVQVTGGSCNGGIGGRTAHVQHTVRTMLGRPSDSLYASATQDCYLEELRDKPGVRHKCSLKLTIRPRRQRRR